MEYPKAEIRLETHPTPTPILVAAWILIDGKVVATVDPENVLRIAERLKTMCRGRG